MKFKLGAVLLLFMLGSSASAAPSPCGKNGMTSLRANDGSGFLFYVFRESPDLYFALTGKQISFPNGTSGPRRFIIDGNFYENLMVQPTDFMKPEQGVADLDILKKHQAYEFDYMQKTPTPLRKLVELGPRVKAAANGQPGFTFYLWAALDPRDQNGARQYFLTTVSAGEVVVLTAIVRDQSANDRAMQAFESYANSFQHVLKKKDCPEK
ncbi:MAG: hypothetical protein JWM21_4477 [Acidobacteria bacterium]|nr:hypothetical protein [Acidobacteriota bacterium]